MSSLQSSLSVLSHFEIPLRHASERSPTEFTTHPGRDFEAAKAQAEEAGGPVLDETDVSGIISSATLMADRLKFLDGSFSTTRTLSSLKCFEIWRCAYGRTVDSGRAGRPTSSNDIGCFADPRATAMPGSESGRGATRGMPSGGQSHPRLVVD